MGTVFPVPWNMSVTEDRSSKAILQNAAGRDGEEHPFQKEWEEQTNDAHLTEKCDACTYTARSHPEAEQPHQHKPCVGADSAEGG